MNLILHIGLPKTGTTALQNWLSCNMKELRENDIYYIPSVMIGHRLAVETIPLSNRHYQPDILNIKHTQMAQVDLALNKAVSSGAKNLLISSEYFYISDPSLLIRVINNYHINLKKIICFVRRQDELLASGYNQDIKCLKRYMPFKVPGYFVMYDWLQMMNNWLAHSPKSLFRLKNYDYHKLNLSLFDTFAEELSLTTTLNKPVHKFANESLHAELLEMTRVANSLGHFAFAEHAIKAQQNGFKGSKFCFSDKIKKKILSYYKKSNKRIFKETGLEEFRDFASANEPDSPGIDLTNNFPVEYAIEFFLWYRQNIS
ncbi:MAG: hypothetical protein OEV64_01105 [Desulfobulbaceae bacterium]|nr:hypothetical protein [Desulfobulbaceae bacterium]